MLLFLDHMRSGICLDHTAPVEDLLGSCRVGGSWWWVCWLVFENCIVDASIFDRLCISY